MTETEKIEIKNQIKELQEKLKAENSPIARITKSAPYTAIRYSEHYEAFYFSKSRVATWTSFLKIAKELFLIDKEVDVKIRGCYKFYDAIVKTPKNTSELTKEQKEIAAKFLDEVIEVFNKYFLECNKDIVVNGQLLTVTETEESIDV